MKPSFSASYQLGARHILRLATGDDLFDGITTYAVANGISSGWVHCLGAVRRAHLQVYLLDEKRYSDIFIEEPLELLGGTGNISMLNGSPFLHLHASFSNKKGEAFGGHVTAGCEVFVGEVSIQELSGPPPERTFDDCTGLSLWSEIGPQKHS